MPVDWSKYPKNWREIRARVQARAGDRCEACGVQNHAVGYRRPDGSFYRLRGNGPCDYAGFGQSWPSGHRLSYSEAREFADQYNDHADGRDADGNRWFVIVCTVAHLDHDTTNNADANLSFRCQKCHLSLDAPLHARNAAETRRRKNDERRGLFATEAA